MMAFTNEQIRQMFYAWLDGGEMEFAFSTMQPALASMTEKLPSAYCERLNLPPNSTVGHAARSLIVVSVDEVEHLLEGCISFHDEEESARWWADNWNNPSRVRLTHVSEGQWQLTIAPISGAQTPSWGKSGF